MLASRTASLMSPVPLSDIESILEWVDNFKLSRSTKKIHRDFSDAVLLAEILFLYYPKLVEMHNYPPRNSSALKLNNWMTLNRKVLRKLKLHLCTETMEQLANSTPGIIERILLMVRDKIRKDEEANKSMNDEQELSSGGSYYEACTDEENVLVVPVKARVNGMLEFVQQKVVTYNAHVVLKEELKDAKEAIDVLKQKVQHLEQLMKLKEERVDELQSQLDRKAIRRKESDTTQNNLTPNTSLPVSQKTSEVTVYYNSIKNHLNDEDNVVIKNSKNNINECINNNIESGEKSESKINEDETALIAEEIKSKFIVSNVLENVIKSANSSTSQRLQVQGSDEDFKDSMQDLTIEQSVYKEVVEIVNLAH